MELILKRIAKKKSYTIGKLYIKQTPSPLPLKGEDGHSPELSDNHYKTSSQTHSAPSLTGRAGGESLCSKHSAPSLTGRAGGESLCSEHFAPSLTGRAGGESLCSEHSALPLTGERGEGLLLYFCDTLEPTWRDYAHGGYKVKGHSAIPEGRYPVVVSWSPKFQQWLPLLLHVPKFEGIRIHAGNTCCDTAGCILLGENREPGKVLDSQRYVNLLKRRLAQRPEGEPVYITIE